MNENNQVKLVKFLEALSKEIPDINSNVYISSKKGTTNKDIIISDIYNEINEMLDFINYFGDSQLFAKTIDKNDSFDKNALKCFIGKEIKIIESDKSIVEEKYLADLTVRLHDLIKNNSAA